MILEYPWVVVILLIVDQEVPPSIEASQRTIDPVPPEAVTEPELFALQTVAAPVRVPATVAGQTLKDLAELYAVSQVTEGGAVENA